MVHIETQHPALSSFADTGFDAALYAGTPEQVARLARHPGAVADARRRGAGVQPAPARSRCAAGAGAVPTSRWPPQALAQLPLLQQSTRPYGWRQWFDAMGVHAPHALDGPRYELFSMIAVAATHGMGVALMPPLLIEAELASGELVVACNSPCAASGRITLISPAQAQPRC